MTTPVMQVLVGPLRRDDRRTAMLARLEQLSAPQRAVLRGCYLEPRAPEEVAAACSVTVQELALVRTDALRALGRTRTALPAQVRREVPAAYR